MLKSIVLFVAVCMFGLDLMAAAPAEPASVVQASLIKRIPPRYPARAIDRGQEGWVDLRFTITPEGTTSDIRVVASYPRGVFDRTAINAVTNWIYAPRTEGGSPVPQPDNRAILSFALAESTTLRESLASLAEAAFRQIAARDWEAAKNSIDELGEKPELNLYELAVLEQLRGRLAFARHDYPAAVDSFSRALSVTTRFTADVRAGIYEALVLAALNAQQFERAVEAFDAWNPPDMPHTRELRRNVESVRSARGAKPVDRASSVSNRR